MIVPIDLRSDNGGTSPTNLALGSLILLLNCNECHRRMNTIEPLSLRNSKERSIISSMKNCNSLELQSDRV